MSAKLPKRGKGHRANSGPIPNKVLFSGTETANTYHRKCIQMKPRNNTFEVLTFGMTPVRTITFEDLSIRDLPSLMELANGVDYRVTAILEPRSALYPEVTSIASDEFFFVDDDLDEECTANKNKQLLDSITKQLWRLDSGYFGEENVKPTEIERKEYLTTHPSIHEATDFSARCRHKDLKPTVVGSAHEIISRVNGKDVAEDFLRKLVKGAELKEDSPSYRFRRQIDGNGKRPKDDQIKKDEMLRRIIHVFNMEMEGRVVSRLHSPKVEGIPEVRRAS